MLQKKKGGSGKNFGRKKKKNKKIEPSATKSLKQPLGR